MRLFVICFLLLMLESTALAQSNPEILSDCGFERAPVIQSQLSPVDAGINFTNCALSVTMEKTSLLLSGILTDSWHGTPVSGVVVFVDNVQFATSDGNGHYSVPIANGQQLWFFDPLSRYHDYVKYFDLTSGDSLSIPMIPKSVELEFLKMVSATGQRVFPKVREWDLPIDVYVNVEGCVLAFGDSACAESVRVAMDSWELASGLNLFNEVSQPLDTSHQGQIGITLSYGPGFCGTYGARYEPDGTPRLGFLSMYCHASGVAMHEFGHAFGFNHTGGGFLMSRSGGILTQIETDIVKTLFLLPNFTDLSSFAPYATSFATPNRGETWTLDDVVLWSHGAVAGQFPEYVQNAPLIVSASDTLVILAGSTVDIAPSGGFTSDIYRLNSKWLVYGTVRLTGTRDSSVTITSGSEFKGDWDWLQVRQGGLFVASHTVFRNSRSFLWSDWGSRIAVSNCLFSGFSGYDGFGLRLYALFANGYVSSAGSFQVFNSTFDGSNLASNTHAVIGVVGSREYSFRNNIVINSPYGIYEENNSATSQRDHNLFYQVPIPYNLHSRDSTEFTADPLFIPGTEDSTYLLSIGSPAIDVGYPDSLWNDPDQTRSDLGYRYFDQSEPLGIKFSEPPLVFRLFNNYPNPFNPLTSISFSLPGDSRVTLQVFDLLGGLVATIVDEFRAAGNYSQQYEPAGLASGIYFYRLTAGDYVSTKKLVLMK